MPALISALYPCHLDVLKSRIVSRLPNFGNIIAISLTVLLASMLLGASALPARDQTEQARAFTRELEFDYVGWTLDALKLKLFQGAVGVNSFISVEARRQLVMDYLVLVAEVQHLESLMSAIFADPSVDDPQQASRDLRLQIDQMNERRARLQPVAEAILQDQVSTVIDEMGLSFGGQPVPPVLYHSTPLPLALIISPREVIRLDENISLSPDLPIDKRDALEGQVDQSLDVSSLVVEIGGVGLYPTMVQQTSNLNWLSEVVAHEWTHNFLTLRPLGAGYMSSPEMRVINETAASIAGKEIGLRVLERYYPELVPPPPAPVDPGAPPPEPPAFDYRAEMHETRVTADQLLAEGKIEEAEAYMEARRIVFWENGYRHLRKLNQAYFAFYGAYADQPGGAAGGVENPVGAAVRALRAQSDSLADFLNRISWVTSFEELLRMVEEGQGSK